MSSPSMTRPLEHSIMPMNLQAHFGPGYKALTPAETDMFLREAALHCRSLIVVDSDLNNNSVLHEAASYDGGVFWNGLRSGFVRRAVREAEPGVPARQTAILEALRKVNRDRAVASPEYVHRLDTALTEAEKSHEPLLWRRSDVDPFSLSRLRLGLEKLARHYKNSSGLIGQVHARVEMELDTGDPFGAANIEEIFGGDGKVVPEEWQAIWAEVAEAQSGNIPFIYNGRLGIGTTPGERDRYLAAGPNSVGLERRVEAHLYRPQSGVGMRLNVEQRVAPYDGAECAYRLNRSKLAELRLEEIEDLREEALGGDFFQARFNSNGSGSDLLEGATPYSYSMNEYHERLARAGILRTHRLERAAVGEALRQVVLTVEQENSAREIIMEQSHGSNYPLAEASIVMCDSRTIIDCLGNDGARQFGAPIGGDWTYRRPDYRILEHLGAS